MLSSIVQGRRVGFPKWTQIETIWKLYLIFYTHWSKGYLHIGNIMVDDFFIRRDLIGQKYKLLLDKAEELFPMFIKSKYEEWTILMNIMEDIYFFFSAVLNKIKNVEYFF